MDHHLLQIGYNLDHSEIFIENGKKYRKKDTDVTPSLPSTASRVNSGFVSWETYAIFKDNDRERSYGFGEMVSGLGGNDVGVIQPPFQPVRLIHRNHLSPMILLATDPPDQRVLSN